MADATQHARQPTLLDFKDEYRDVFGCILSHLNAHDRLFLSKTARGFRDVFSFPSRIKKINDHTTTTTKTTIVEEEEEEGGDRINANPSSSRGEENDGEDVKNNDDENKTHAGWTFVPGAGVSKMVPVVPARGLIRSAAMAGWFLSQGCGDSGYHIMTSAVENGCVEALEELMHPRSAKLIVCNFNDDCRDWSLSRFAAEHGQMEVLRWLKTEGHDWCEYTWSAVSRAAARGGHVDILKWLHATGCPALKNASTAAGAAAGAAGAPLPYYKRKRLAADGGGCGGDIISEAARWGRLDALVFLRDIGVPWPSTGCRTAILCGDHDVVKWMVREGCPLGDIFPCSSIVSFIASVPDSIGILQWLKDEQGMGEPGGGLFRDDATGADKADALRAAAYHGNFPVMRWLRMEAGAEWSEETTAAAADGGSIECLSWLHANECPWDEETAVMAAAGGHLDLLQYTHREGLRAGPSGRVCAAAAGEGHMEALHWLVRNGYPVDEAAAETHSEWLVETGRDGTTGGGNIPVAAELAVTAAA